MKKTTAYSQAGLDQLTKENIKAGKIAFKNNDGNIVPIKSAFGDDFLLGEFGKLYSIEELVDLLRSGQHYELVMLDKEQQPKFHSSCGTSLTEAIQSLIANGQMAFRIDNKFGLVTKEGEFFSVYLSDVKFKFKLYGWRRLAKFFHDRLKECFQQHDRYEFFYLDFDHTVKTQKDDDVPSIYADCGRAIIDASIPISKEMISCGINDLLVFFTDRTGTVLIRRHSVKVEDQPIDIIAFELDGMLNASVCNCGKTNGKFTYTISKQ